MEKGGKNERIVYKRRIFFIFATGLREESLPASLPYSKTRNPAVPPGRRTFFGRFSALCTALPPPSLSFFLSSSFLHSSLYFPLSLPLSLFFFFTFCFVFYLFFSFLLFFSLHHSRAFLLPRLRDF